MLLSVTTNQYLMLLLLCYQPLSINCYCWLVTTNQYLILLLLFINHSLFIVTAVLSSTNQYSMLLLLWYVNLNNITCTGVFWTKVKLAFRFIAKMENLQCNYETYDVITFVTTFLYTVLVKLRPCTKIVTQMRQLPVGK